MTRPFAYSQCKRHAGKEENVGRGAERDRRDHAYLLKRGDVRLVLLPVHAGVLGEFL